MTKDKHKVTRVRGISKISPVYIVDIHGSLKIGSLNLTSAAH